MSQEKGLALGFICPLLVFSSFNVLYNTQFQDNPLEPAKQRFITYGRIENPYDMTRCDFSRTLFPPGISPESAR